MLKNKRRVRAQGKGAWYNRLKASLEMAIKDITFFCNSKLMIFLLLYLHWLNFFNNKVIIKFLAKTGLFVVAGFFFFFPSIYHSLYLFFRLSFAFYRPQPRRDLFR